LQSIAGFLFGPAAGKGGISEKGKNMKAKYKRVTTRFAPELKFEVEPTPPEPLRARQEAELERLKARLLAARLGAARDGQLVARLRRAAAEAAALSWVTRYPLLLFPGLFQEMAEAAVAHAERQDDIRQRSHLLLAA
jgi:hypothetical protein